MVCGRSTAPTRVEAKIVAAAVHAQAHADEGVAFVIDGDRVTGHGGTAACEITIDAHLVGDQLDGTLRHPACPSCAPAPFHATRGSSKR